MPAMQPLPATPSNLHCAEDAGELASASSLHASDVAWAPPPLWPSCRPAVPSDEPYEAHQPISDLLAAELEHAPQPGYSARFRDGSLDDDARRDAVDWILKVHAFYGFQPATALLAVNYLDRFLSSRTLPKETEWPWQLLSVACLSVAAKMEETEAPPLLDLQIMEPRFLFEPRTVRRMELLLMAALRWRMRTVTPLDFVAHFAGVNRRHAAVFSRASELVMGAQQVVEFLGFRPSETAAAAVLCAAGDGGDELPGFYDVVHKDAVEGCRRLMEEYLLDAPRSHRRDKGAPAGPRSPAGVLDAAACGSRDTQPSAASTADPDTEPSAAAAGEPPTKRRRLPTPPPCISSKSDGSVVDGGHL